MPSSPDKVDLERLRRDIPKFLDNSRIITIEQREWWQNWFDNAETVYGPGPPKPNTWLLDDLKSMKVNCTTRQDQQDVAQTWLDGTETPPGIPDDVAQIVAAPCAEIPEVLFLFPKPII